MSSIAVGLVADIFHDGSTICKLPFSQNFCKPRCLRRVKLFSEFFFGFPKKCQNREKVNTVFPLIERDFSLGVASIRKNIIFEKVIEAPGLLYRGIRY